MRCPHRVVLDFDGVILESVRVKLESFQGLFAGLPASPAIKTYLDANTGLSRYVKFRHIHENILRVPYNSELEKELDLRYSGMVLERVLASPFVAGAEDFLAWCPVPMDAVSAMPLTELRFLVERLGLSSRFDRLYGAPGRKSDQLREILADKALAGEDILFVGDSAEDATAARDAGTVFVGRVNPENPRDFPQPRVADLAELKKLLTPIFADARKVP